MPAHPSPPKMPHVDERECQLCRKCMARKACRVKAVLTLDPGEAPLIDGNRCYGCLICIPACPYGAIAA